MTKWYEEKKKRTRFTRDLRVCVDIDTEVYEENEYYDFDNIIKDISKFDIEVFMPHTGPEVTLLIKEKESNE